MTSSWRKRKRREIEPDAHDPDRIKVPRTRIPEPIIPGVKGWHTSDGWLVVRVHYSADPDVDEDWISETSKGYRGGTRGRDWQREMEIDFGAYQGDPVYPDFNGQRSVRQISYDPSLPLWRGWDFGYRSPAVVFVQYDPGEDQLRVLAELFPTKDKTVLPGLKTPDLARLVLAETERLFPDASNDDAGAGVLDYCDPSGIQTKETSDFSSVEHLQTFGIFPEFSVVGRKNRIEYLRNYIEDVRDDNEPKLLIHPRCDLTIKALDGAYHYPEEAKGGVDRDMPDTSKKEQSKPYVHLMDAMEYIAAVELSVEEADQRRSAYERPDSDDGNVAGDSLARLVARQDIYSFDAEGQARALDDPEVFIDQLLGIEEDLDRAFDLV